MIFPALLLGIAFAARSQDRVESLPNALPFLSPWYSGHLQVSAYRHLHYVFIESQRNVTTDPILVWFAGGPGGSSIPDLYAGLGPYRFDENSNITYNPYSFTNKSSVLYVDNPAGVGYSYASRDIDFCQTDL